MLFLILLYKEIKEVFEEIYFLQSLVLNNLTSIEYVGDLGHPS
jgi:hypothetical protein